MQQTLHATPRGRDVIVEQIRVVGLALRSAMVVAAVVVGIAAILIAVDIAHGKGATWFDSNEWFPLNFIAFLVPFAVWRREHFGPGFLWTLPVDRRRLALAKVFAGWVWWLAGMATFVAWQFLLASLAGVSGAQIFPPIAFLGTTAAYLLGSAVMLGLRYPLRWLFGSAGLLILLAIFNQRVDAIVSSAGLVPLIDRFLPLLPFLSFAAGLAALWAAVSRHGEQRRR